MTDAVSHSIAPLVMSSSQHVGSSQFIIPSSQNDSIMAEPPQYDDQRCSSMQFGLDLPGKIEFQEQRQHANQPSLSQLAFDDGTASLRNSQAFNSQMLNDSQQLHEFTRDMSGIDHQSALSHPHVPFGPASFPAINFVLPSGPIDPQMMSLLAMMAQNQTGSQRMPEASPLPNLPHPSLMKPEHKDSRAIRRGPMDEMRQLLRILVKLFPQAPLNTSAPDSEGGASGGGNRLSGRIE